MASRNPFRIRTAEYLEDNREFLHLFGLNALDVFEPDDMWARIQIIRSARGGGKTSILRIFSPKSLNAIAESRNTEKITPLYKKLEELDVYTKESQTKILGVTLSMFGNYPILKQLGFDKQKQERIFFALLTSKIIIAALRNVCELKKLTFPENLDQIMIRCPSDASIPTSVPVPCNGKDLYEWASSLEKKIFDIMEDGSDESGLEGYQTLSALHIIRPSNILYDGEEVAEKTLLMLDDVDKITSEQRKDLADVLPSLRLPIAIWLAERLEALDPSELFSSIGTQGREYGEPKNLERFWISKPTKFTSLLKEISDKRALSNSSYNISSFVDSIDGELGADWNEKLNDAINTESQRLKTKYAKKTKYTFWIERCENFKGDLSKKLEEWRNLEIEIERDIAKGQLQLFDEKPLPVNDFHEKHPGAGFKISDYYVRTKHNIPFYFGFDKLVKLASSNVQQFLYLASDLFDEMINSKNFNEDSPIKPSRQEQILKKAVDRRWDEISKYVPHSDHVITFLDNIAEFCLSQTNLPNSPYGGVTGIAMSTSDLKHIQSTDEPRYKLLLDVLSICISHNLLEAHPNYKQGQKGTINLVLYLNRLLCCKYNLPLAYGGWRHKKLEIMCKFLDMSMVQKNPHTMSAKNNLYADVIK